MLYGLGKPLRQVCPLNGEAGGFRFVAVHIGPEGHRTQHHLRVFQIIAVERNTVLGLSALHPFGQLLRGAVTLLEKENIRRDLSSGVGLEGVVWQADRAKQVGLLRQHFPDLAVFLIQRAFAGDKGHDAAGTHLI